MGSNPIPSANPSFPGVSGCLAPEPELRTCRVFLSSVVSRRIVLSQHRWGNEAGMRLASPISIPAAEAGTMARTGKLSAVEVMKAKRPAVLHDGGGLYLRVSGTDAKSWVSRFQMDGKRRDMGLGPYPDVSLAEARDKATAHRRERHNGTDPLDAREARRQAERVAVAKGRTFREVAEEFIDRNKAGWRNAKHRQQWGN